MSTLPRCLGTILVCILHQVCIVAGIINKPSIAMINFCERLTLGFGRNYYKLTFVLYNMIFLFVSVIAALKNSWYSGTISVVLTMDFFIYIAR
jgi:hypothetical protein